MSANSETGRYLYQRVRAAFLAGVLVVVPMAVSAWVILSMADLLEGTLVLVPGSLRPANPLARTGLGISLALMLVMGVGFSASSYLGNRLILLSEALLAKVPFLSTLYGGVKQLLEALFTTDKQYFERAVFLQWPAPGYYALAFCTGESFLQVEGGAPLVNLFMPTTPNITTGFYLVTSRDKVIPTDMSVDEAFKLLMSAGIISPSRPMLLDAEGVRRLGGQLDAPEA
ncbi:MAG: DUF502 domain-containing protein [Deltaproteobacteria bacterium]|nr:DUF502 domain-containing protein [Deltaproteobacteria bacterium]